MSKDLPARYYQKNKERIEKKSQERIKIFLQKEKTKQEYGCEQYKNFSQTKKQRQVNFAKIYYEMQNNKKTDVL